MRTESGEQLTKNQLEILLVAMNAFIFRGTQNLLDKKFLIEEIERELGYE